MALDTRTHLCLQQPAVSFIMLVGVIFFPDAHFFCVRAKKLTLNLWFSAKRTTPNKKKLVHPLDQTNKLADKPKAFNPREPKAEDTRHE
jgi:hypothetical protein